MNETLFEYLYSRALREFQLLRNCLTDYLKGCLSIKNNILLVTI